MNLEQFKKLKADVPNFVKDHCFFVDPEKLIYDKNNSQIRANGHVVNKFSDFAELISNEVDLPPISVRRKPNGLFELKEGCTRAGGAELAGKKILATDYMDTVLRFTASDWREWQAQGNDHPSASPNTDKDIELFISTQIQNGDLDKRFGFKYDGSENKYVEAAAKRYRHVIYKNSGKDLDYFRRKVKKCLKTKVRSFYENYSSKQAFEFYSAQTNFSGKKTGDVSGNQVVYTFSETNHSTPAVIGHVASKVIDNPGVKVILVYHVGSLVGKNDQSIFKERKKIEDWYDKVNNAHGWFGELHFLPQIKQGPNQENMFTLIKSR
jgi:hypothetical protein